MISLEADAAGTASAVMQLFTRTNKFRKQTNIKRIFSLHQQPCDENFSRFSEGNSEAKKVRLMFDQRLALRMLVKWILRTSPVISFNWRFFENFPRFDGT